MLKSKHSISKSENITDSTTGNTHSYDGSNDAKNIDAHGIDETPRNSSYIGHIAKQTLGLFTGNSENEHKEGSKHNHSNVEKNQKLKNTNEHFDSTGNAYNSDYTYSSMADPVINKNDVVQSEHNVQETKQQMKTGEYDSIKNQENESNLNRESEAHIASPSELKHGSSKPGSSDFHSRTGSHSGSGSGHGILRKLGIQRKSKSESSSDNNNTASNAQNNDAIAGNSSDQYFEPTYNFNVVDSHGKKQDVTKSSDESYDQKNQGDETFKKADRNQGIESPNDLYGNAELEKPGNTYKTGFESSVNKKKDQDTKASRDTSDNPHQAPLDEFAMKDQYAKQHEKNIMDKQKGEVVDADDYLNPAPVCKNSVAGVDPIKTDFKNVDKNVNLNRFDNGKNNLKEIRPALNQKDLDDQPLAPVLESLKLNESKTASGYTDELSNPQFDHKKNTKSITNPELRHESGNNVENGTESENQGILGTIYGYLGMQTDENGEDQNVNPDHLEATIPGNYYDYENIETNLGDQTKTHFTDKDGGEFEKSDTYAMKAGDNSRMDPMKHDKMAGAVDESTPYNYVKDPSNDNYLVSKNAQDLKISKNCNVPLMADSAAGAATGAATGATMMKTKAGSKHHATVQAIDNYASKYVATDVRNPAKNDMLSGATVESTPYRMVQDPNHKEYLQTKNANLLKSKKGINDSHIGTSDLVNKEIKSKKYYDLKRDTISDPAHYLPEHDNNQFVRNRLDESKLSGSRSSDLASDYRRTAKSGRGEENNEFNSKKVTDNRDNYSDYNTENKQDENWLSYILGRGNNNDAEAPSDHPTKRNDDNDFKLKKKGITSAEAGADDGVGAGIGTVGLRINRNSGINDQEVLRDDDVLNDKQPLFEKNPAWYKESPQYGLHEHIIDTAEINQKGLNIKQSVSDDLLYSDKKRSLNYRQIVTDDDTMRKEHSSSAVRGVSGITLSSEPHPVHNQINQNIATDAKTTNANITGYSNKHLAGNDVTDDIKNQINDASMPSGDYQRKGAKLRKDVDIIGNQSNTGDIATGSDGNNDHLLAENMQSSKIATNQKDIPVKSQDKDYRGHRKTSSSGSGKNKLMAMFGKDNKNNTDVQDIEKTTIKTRGTKYGVIHDEGAKALKESMKSPSATAKVNHDEYDDFTGGGQVGRRKSWIEKIKDKVT